MKALIHFVGCPCAGKTTTALKIIEKGMIGYWDILSFYEKEGIIKNGVMDWVKFKEKSSLIIPDLKKAIITQKELTCLIVETSGNKYVESFLEEVSEKVEVFTFYFKTPKAIDLVTRAVSRGMDPYNVLDMALFYNRNIHVLGEEPELIAIEVNAILKEREK